MASLGRPSDGLNSPASLLDRVCSHSRSSKQGGGVTHIGAVYIAATGVKMWSNGQDTFLGVVKRSSSIPGPILLPLLDR